jgi:hypothetical protein
MPNVRPLLYGLVGLDFLLLLSLLVTGVLQLVQKDSAALRIVHRWSAILAIALCALVHAAVLAFAYPVVFRLISFVEFLALTFVAGFSGWTAKPGVRRILHVVLGSATFLLFTAIIFRFVLAAT